MTVGYSSWTYQVSPAQREQWRQLESWRSAMQWLMVWPVVAGLIWLGQQSWWLYPFAILFIAGRAGVLLQLVHEATHGLLVRNKWNERLGDWLCAAPLGLSLEEYRYGHLRHHAFTNTEADPLADREKYRVCDVRQRALWGLFLQDLCGWTALKVRWLYRGNWSRSGWEKYARIACVQAVLWLTLFQQSVLTYWLFWIVPLTTVHMALMRIRGIGEHGLLRQLGGRTEEGHGTFYTRSCAVRQSWLERLLIGSLHVGYHHEHHLFPWVPYYHLPRVSAVLKPQVEEKLQLVYQHGYLGSLVFPWRAGLAAR